MPPLDDRPRSFLGSLARLSAEATHDAFVNEVLETFGRFDPPNGELSHRWTLDLHGICADGATEEEAICNWRRLARRQLLQDAPAQINTASDHIGYLPASAHS